MQESAKITTQKDKEVEKVRDTMAAEIEKQVAITRAQEDQQERRLIRTFKLKF